MRNSRGWLVFGLIVLGVVVIGLAVLAGVFGSRWGWWGRGGMMGFCPWCGGPRARGGFGVFESLLACGVSLAFLALVIVGVVVLVRATGGPAVQQDAALDILKERYARGEITSEQYEEMRRELTS